MFGMHLQSFLRQMYNMKMRLGMLINFLFYEIFLLLKFFSLILS